VTGLRNYVYKLGPYPYLLPDGSAAAGFVNFIGGNSDKENRKQICDVFPKEIQKYIPICQGTAA
jgi:hypothetical protein